MSRGKKSLLAKELEHFLDLAVKGRLINGKDARR